MGLTPGRKHAQAAGLSETVGGTLLALGALTPVASSMITGTMAVAIDKVHAKNGPWVTEGGFEYNLVLIAVVLALAAEGPGPFSIDEKLGIETSGPAAALAALALGVGGAAAVSRLAVVPSLVVQLGEASCRGPFGEGAVLSSVVVVVEPAG